jgi:hypothetical protein
MGNVRSQCWQGRHIGVPAASLRKFTLVYCTQDQPLSSAVRVAAQRTPRSLAEECGYRKHDESSACVDCS